MDVDTLPSVCPDVCVQHTHHDKKKKGGAYWVCTYIQIDVSM